MGFLAETSLDNIVACPKYLNHIVVIFIGNVMSFLPIKKEDLWGSVEAQTSKGRDFFEKINKDVGGYLGMTTPIPDSRVSGPGAVVSPNQPTPSSDSNVLAFPHNLGRGNNPHFAQFEVFIINSGQMFDQASARNSVDLNSMPRMTHGETAAGTLSQSTKDVVTTKYVKLQEMIGMPIPDSVIADHATVWSKEGGGWISGMASWADTLTTSKTSLSTDVEMVAKRAGLGALSGIGSIIDSVGLDGATTALKIATKRTKNPRAEFLFDGVNNRSFTFNWKLVPKSEEEWAAIYGIVERFKLYMYPELDVAMSGAFYIFPAVFDITFKSGENENIWLYRTTSCALTNMIVNYTGAGQWVAMEKNNAPFALDLTLSFTEVEFLHRQRFTEGIVR